MNMQGREKRILSVRRTVALLAANIVTTPIEVTCVDKHQWILMKR
jgi:hypothetical protein